MAVKPLQQSYPQIEQECLYKWRVMLRIPIQCASETTSVIFGIEKVKTAAPILPMQDGNQSVGFEEAWESISDPLFTEALKQNNIINWTRCTKRVIAIVVPGDGNSLCHAIAVQLCGVIDHVLFFRRCLKETCDKQVGADSPLRQRWTAYTKLKCQQLEKTCSEEGLRQGWGRVCEASSLRPVENRSSLRQSQTIYSPLSQFHIFIMSQITRRPIIITGQERNDFKPSIYLPIMIPIEECINSPIYLSYHNGHFAPLLFIDEDATGSKFQDLCIPITDKNFKPFDFPYLLQGEDGMSLLKRFASTSGIAYTTKHEILEVPAVRVPEGNSQSCNNFTIDPSWFIRICSDRLEQGGEPSDVFNLWKYMFELHRIFEEQLPVGLTFENATQPLSKSLQPENDVEEAMNLRQLRKPILTVSPPTLDAADASSQQMDVDDNDTTQTIVKLLEVDGDKNHDGLSSASSSNENRGPGKRRSNSSCSKESGYKSDEGLNSAPTSPLLGCPTNSDQDNLLEHSTPQLENVPLPPPEANSTNYSSLSLSHPKYSNIESDDAGYEEDHSHHLTPVYGSLSSFQMHSESLILTHNTEHEAAEGGSSSSHTGSFRSHSRSLLNGVTANYVSKHEIVITNCKNIVFTVVKLTSQDGNKEVTFTLEKSGLNTRDKVNLSFPSDQTLEVHYIHKYDDVLNMRLMKLQENLYGLTVFLPNAVVVKPPSQEQNLAETMTTSDCYLEGDYVDMEDHPFKCRTAGCNGRAIKRYRNLCMSCHEAWREMLDQSAETSAPFSYLDSVTSVEEATNDGTCEISSCNNQGEARYYGFCETCFHTPAI